MTTRVPIFIVLSGLVLIVAALESHFISDGLALVGMDIRAARLAGSRLGVLGAMVGAGLMFIGLSAWARASRIRSTGIRFATALDRIANPHGAHSVLVPGAGVGFAADIDGLRMEVVVEPERHGRVFVRARCQARMPCVVWPRGMDDENSRYKRVATGTAWEAWSLSQRGEPLSWASVDAVLSRAFGPGAAHEIRHDAGGIEVSMSNAPSTDLEGRILVGIDAASALARLNR